MPAVIHTLQFQPNYASNWLYQRLTGNFLQSCNCVCLWLSNARELYEVYEVLFVTSCLMSSFYFSLSRQFFDLHLFQSFSEVFSDTLSRLNMYEVDTRYCPCIHFKIILSL